MRNPDKKLIELEREEEEDGREMVCGCGGDGEIIEWSNICLDSFSGLIRVLENASKS